MGYFNLSFSYTICASRYFILQGKPPYIGHLINNTEHDDRAIINEATLYVNICLHSEHVRYIAYVLITPKYSKTIPWEIMQTVFQFVLSKSICLECNSINKQIQKTNTQFVLIMLEIKIKCLCLEIRFYLYRKEIKPLLHVSIPKHFLGFFFLFYLYFPVTRHLVVLWFYETPCFKSALISRV